MQAPAAVSGSPSLPDPKDKIQQQNLLHKAMLASETGRLAEAREALETVIRMDPGSYLALQQLGNLELDTKQYANAVELLRQAQKLHGPDAASAFSEGRALERLHDLAGARDALESSLKLAAGQFQARLLLGQVYLGLHNFSAAEDQLEAALLLEPKSVDAQLWLARAHMAGGKFADAVAELRQASRSNGRNAELLDLLVQAYRAMGKETEARQLDGRRKLLDKTKEH
jgi:predicted Zn-dependent protease